MAYEAVRKNKLTSDRVVVDGRRYRFDIIRKSNLPEVPYFVGYPKSKYLFISEEVPKHYRRAWLAHEIYCNRLNKRRPNDSCNCRDASLMELRFVKVNDWKEYAGLRDTMLTRLILREKRKEEPRSGFLVSTVAARDFWRSMHASGLHLSVEPQV